MRERAHLFPIYSQSSDLRVKIGKVSALKEGIVAEPNARHYMAGTEGDLFDFREEFIHRAIEDELSNRLQRNELFRPDLGGVQNIKIKLMLVLLFDNLNCKRPLRWAAIFNSLIKVLPVEI